MKAHDRVVAGIRCTEVLDDLSDYLDGELSDARVRQIEAHLHGCSWCERFGGEFTEAVTALRASLGAASAPPEGVHTRLMERLGEALEG
jgi:anti-sigma factor RsiW